MLQHVSKLHSSLWLNNFPLCGYATFFHAFICWTLGCFLMELGEL